MNEYFLQFLWNYQLFNQNALKTVNGDAIKIIKKGQRNDGEGPDFLYAEVLIGNTLWCGHIEIHNKASDWYRHKHHEHFTYNLVVLHVVWQSNAMVFNNGNEVATLDLSIYVSDALLKKHYDFFQQPVSWMLCEAHFQDIDSFYLNNWLRRLFFCRFIDRQKEVTKVLKQKNYNWEAVMFYYLCRALGFNINQSAFGLFANSFPFKLIGKYSSELQVLESLFFGQSGMLLNFIEVPYAKQLMQHYEFLKKKHHLKPCRPNIFSFHRMRPHNFPTVRLAQLAALYNLRLKIFETCMQLNSLKGFINFFTFDVSPFWTNHFNFNSSKHNKLKRFSKNTVMLLLINAILPVKFAYLKQYKNMQIDEVEHFMETLRPESNQVISGFKRIGFVPQNALHTQGLLHLKREFCDEFKCYKCQIGLKILK